MLSGVIQKAQSGVSAKEKKVSTSAHTWRAEKTREGSL